MNEVKNRQPIMPKKGAKKPRIEVAKAELTLNGFVHRYDDIVKKDVLVNKANNAMGMNDARSASQRKSSLKVRSAGLVGYHDEVDPDNESQHDDEIQDPPHNTEFDNYQQDMQNQNLDCQENDKPEVIEEFGPGVATQALNPRSYAFVPSNWTKKIRAAGSNTNRSEGLGAVMHMKANAKKGDNCDETLNAFEMEAM